MVTTVQPQIERLVATRIAAPARAHITGQPTLDAALKDERIRPRRGARS